MQQIVSVPFVRCKELSILGSIILSTENQFYLKYFIVIGGVNE